MPNPPIEYSHEIHEYTEKITLLGEPALSEGLAIIAAILNSILIQLQSQNQPNP